MPDIELENPNMRRLNLRKRLMTMLLLQRRRGAWRKKLEGFTSLGVNSQIMFQG